MLKVLVFNRQQSLIQKKYGIFKKLKNMFYSALFKSLVMVTGNNASDGHAFLTFISKKFL